MLSCLVQESGCGGYHNCRDVVLRRLTCHALQQVPAGLLTNGKIYDLERRVECLNLLKGARNEVRCRRVVLLLLEQLTKDIEEIR